MTDPQPPQLLPDNWNGFSTREWEVMILLAHDLGSEQIVNRLCIAKGTLYNIKREIGVRMKTGGRDGVNRYARQHRAELHYWYPHLCKKPNLALLDPLAPPD